MTYREFLTAVAESDVNEEIRDYALKAINKLDASLEKRRDKPSKASKERDAVRAEIVEFLTNSDNPQSAAEIALHFGFTAQKASGLLKALVTSEAVAKSVRETDKKVVYAIA